MHGWIEDHLGSRDAVRVIYGSVVGLALVVALQDHPPGAGEMTALLLGTAFGVGLAELYSELIGEEAQTRERIHAGRVRRLAGDSVSVAFGVAFPAIFFILAALGVMETDTAFRLAKWTGAVLLCGYAYLAARLAGANGNRAALQALVVGLVGAALIWVKALTH